MNGTDLTKNLRSARAVVGAESLEFIPSFEGRPSWKGFHSDNDLLMLVPFSISTRRWERHLYKYTMGDGEQDSIELCGQETNIEAIVTDEYLAFIAAARLGLKVWMLPDLIVELVNQGKLTVRLARMISTRTKLNI